MTALDLALREMLREVVRDVVRDEVLPRLPALAQSEQQNSDRYLTTDEAAEVAGVKPDTIRDWVKDQKLCGHHAGRHLRIRLCDLQMFLSDGANAKGPTDMELEERAVALVNRRKRAG